MSRLKGIAARLRSSLRPRSAEQRMEEEFAFHVEMETERLRAEGVPPDEARRRARARFGGFDHHREEMREGRLAHWLHDVHGDLRYGTRMLWKQKVLTFVAVVSLTVGIGANSAIFSIVNSILLRPRAVADPGQLVQLYVGDRRSPYETTSYPSYLDLRDRNHVLSGLAAYGLGWQFRLSGASDVELVWGEVVSGNYFDVLGVQAQLGRTFLAEEDQIPNRNPVVVIGHGLWQRRFGSDPGLVGRTIAINSQPLTVIGIAPPEYTGMMTGWASEIWIPAMIMPLLDPSQGSHLVTSRGSRWATLVGRLKPGTTIEAARRRFDLLTRTMQEEHPDEWRKRQETGVRELFVTVLPEKQTRVRPTLRPAVYALAALLFVVVDLVLVIACMNLASMLFARGVARRNEIAVRLALGAARARIVRQLLTESLLLSLLAGIAGIILAYWALSAAMAFMPALPEGIRVALDVRMDWRVAAYTLSFATATGLLFGLAPALHASRSTVASVLKDDGRALSGSSQTSRARKALVVLQVAFSLILLIGAGLVLRSLENVRPTSLGFTSENMVVAPLSLDDASYDRQKAQRFYQQVSGAIAALPGIQAVSLVDGMPGGFSGRTRRGTAIEGYTPRADESMEIDASIVGPRYFTNMGVPIVLGRDFDDRDRDGAPCVAVINEAFAQRYLGGPGSALGKHLAGGGGPSGAERRQCAIVGVVRDDAWQSLQSEVRPFFYLAVHQADQKRMTLLIHTAGDPASSVTGVRRAIRAIDPGIPVADVQTLGDSFRAASYPFRLLGLVLASGGLMALLLAAIGIFGTMSYAVAQRTREVGIRMALGAVRTDILALVVGQGMRLVGYGLGLGLLLGAALTRVLSSMPLEMTLLFGISATDVATFAGVTIFLALIAVMACYVPAWRAAKVDPAVTLRSS